MNIRASSFAGRVRQWFLIAVLLAIGMGAVAHVVRVAHHEERLTEIGHEIVEQYNEDDPRPVPEIGPEADVEIMAKCLFEHVVFGEMRGIVRLVATPRSHAPVDEKFVITHEYVYEDGAWRFANSYLEH